MKMQVMLRFSQFFLSEKNLKNGLKYKTTKKIFFLCVRIKYEFSRENFEDKHFFSNIISKSRESKKIRKEENYLSTKKKYIKFGR